MPLNGIFLASMNRRERRSAAKIKRPAAPGGQQIPQVTIGAKPDPEAAPGPQAKPGLVLRLFAKILLAPWVLKRVRHADVERLIAGVAMQAGRPDIAADLLNRIALRNDARR